MTITRLTWYCSDANFHHLTIRRLEFHSSSTQAQLSMTKITTWFLSRRIVSNGMITRQRTIFTLQNYCSSNHRVHPLLHDITLTYLMTDLSMPKLQPLIVVLICKPVALYNENDYSRVGMDGERLMTMSGHGCRNAIKQGILERIKTSDR